MAVGIPFVASMPSTRSPPEVLAKDDVSAQKLRIVGMRGAVDRALIVDGAALSGLGGDQGPKTRFVDLVEPDVQKGHKTDLVARRMQSKVLSRIRTSARKGVDSNKTGVWWLTERQGHRLILSRLQSR